jgi:hypothetical protein
MHQYSVVLINSYHPLNVRIMEHTVQYVTSALDASIHLNSTFVRGKVVCSQTKHVEHKL